LVTPPNLPATSDLIRLTMAAVSNLMQDCKWREDPPPVAFIKNGAGERYLFPAVQLAGSQMQRDEAVDFLIRSIHAVRATECTVASAAWIVSLPPGASPSQIASTAPLARNPRRREVLTLFHFTVLGHSYFQTNIHRTKGKAPQPGGVEAGEPPD
jgi:hypothetical protein